MKTHLKRLSIFLVFLASIFFMGSRTLQASGIKIYVSVKGNDVNPGTEIHPVATLNAAVERIRKMKLSGDLKGPVEVIIGGGEYHPAKPFVLESGDSGSESSPLIFQAAKDEIPVFSGSIPIKNWKILMNKALLQVLDPATAGKVYVTDLKEQGISDFGDPTRLGARPDLICNGSLQTLARWPNEGFTHAGKVNGQTEMPPTYIKKRGTKEGIFEYIGDRQSRWINETDIRLSGYWYWDWSEEFQKVESVDAVTKNLKIKEPYHKYGYRDSLRYFGLNIFCEMDRPGEYYLDRSSGLLYWFPPEGINPNREKVTLTYFGDPFMIEIRDCSYVSLHGLSFSESRGSAIRITGGDHCLIEDCLIERVGRDGIHVDGGKDHGISGCLLSQLGCSGIHMSGGDRKVLTPANHFIEHTIVEHFSVFKKTYEPAVHLSGCGIRISNNRFSHSSSSAMRLEGNDFLIEYNQVSHVVNESDDQGGIDMFNNPSYQGNVIRYNHWSDIYGGTRHGAAGVRLDDMISGVVVYGNIFERCGARDFGGVQIHGGKDNVIDNNLFFDCNAAVSFSPWSEERWLTQLESPQIRKKLYEEVDIRSDLYRQRYPNLDSLRQHPNQNTIANNLIVDCKNQFLKKNFRQNESNNTSIAAEGNGITHFYSPQVLKKYGLKPIPFNKIGPAKNKWEKLE